jgi:hypothetical protein
VRTGGVSAKFKITLKDSLNTGKKTVLLNDVVVLFKAKV